MRRAMARDALRASRAVAGGTVNWGETMLEEEQVRPYWEARSSHQGARTVGFANSAMDVQDEHHQQRREFIFAHCPRHLPTLDYGCGIGRYAEEFDTYM